MSAVEKAAGGGGSSSLSLDAALPSSAAAEAAISAAIQGQGEELRKYVEAHFKAVAAAAAATSASAAIAVTAAPPVADGAPTEDGLTPPPTFAPAAPLTLDEMRSWRTILQVGGLLVLACVFWCVVCACI